MPEKGQPRSFSLLRFAAPGGGYPNDGGAPQAIRVSLGGSRLGRPEFSK